MTDTDTQGQPGRGLSTRKDGIPLGRIAGIPVVLAYSWFIIAAFTVIVYGPVLLRNNPALGLGAYFVAFAYAVLLLISVLVHELAHALTAKIYHWPTEKIVLNLWGGHTQFESFTASPGRSVLVALAGPAANFVLAGAGWVLLTAGNTSGVADILANIFVWANLLIGIFNVLPGLPLDGGRLVESAVWKVTGSQEKGTVAAGWGGRIIVIALVVWFVALPLLSGERPDISLMLITVLVGSFLWMGATASIQQARLRGRLQLVHAGSLAEPAVGLPETATVAELELLPRSADGFPARRRAVRPGRPSGSRRRRRRGGHGTARRRGQHTAFGRFLRPGRRCLRARIVPGPGAAPVPRPAGRPGIRRGQPGRHHHRTPASGHGPGGPHRQEPPRQQADIRPERVELPAGREFSGPRRKALAPAAVPPARSAATQLYRVRTPS